MKKAFLILLLVVIGLGIAVGISRSEPASPFDEPIGDRMMSIEDYVRINISELSPVKEQLGGNFFVTDIEAKDGKGTVAYEDGHNVYVADFDYSIDKETGITIDSFDIRE
jgi:hypothetical protein